MNINDVHMSRTTPTHKHNRHACQPSIHTEFISLSQMSALLIIVKKKSPSVGIFFDNKEPLQKLKNIKN